MMTKMLSPIISIIVPVYNSGKYLNRFIQSILKQSYKNFEVIFINDGSTDDSVQVINNYNEERFSLFNKKNGGVSSARNEGIKHAKGKYICFFDSDDSIDENTLEQLITKIKDNELLVFCYREIASNNRRVNHFQSEMQVKSADILFRLFYFASKMQIYSPCNKLYVKSVIENNNLSFESGLTIGEDYLFNLSYLENCKSVVFTNDVLYNYYQNKCSAINKLDDDMWEKQLRVIRETYQHIPMYHTNDYEEEFVIKRAIFLFRYYTNHSVSNKLRYVKMASFYDGIRSLSINTHKDKASSLLYRIPFSLLNHKKYRITNMYFNSVCLAIKLKRFVKGMRQK